MIKVLFAVLILGCLVSDILSANGPFEFHDSKGRCWRCQPGASCVRCPTSGPRVVPDSWDRTCQKPSGAVCSQWPNSKFPSRCRDHFYQCQADGQSEFVSCPPERFFDIRAQDCLPIGEVMTQACDNYFDVGTPCGDNIEITTTTTSLAPGETTTTTTPTVSPPTPSVDPDTGSTTTTAAGGGPVTNPPCVCVPFWPCACNPCWHMPCRSCNGCFRMMG